MYGGVTGTQPPYRLELLLPDFKLDGPTTYLSWLYQITGALEGRGLDGYLTEEEKEPHVKMSSECKELPTCLCILGFSIPWFHQFPPLLMEFKM